MNKKEIKLRREVKQLKLDNERLTLELHELRTAGGRFIQLAESENGTLRAALGFQRSVSSAWKALARKYRQKWNKST
jgi:cell shape-determining protein MreC